MTDINDPRKGSARENEPSLSHVLNDAAGDPGEEASGGVMRRHRQESWLQKNANVLILAGGFGVSLLLLVVLGWQLGWIGGGAKPAAPPATAQPASTPTAPAVATSPQPASKPAAPAVATSPQPPAKPAPATPSPSNPKPAARPGLVPLTPSQPTPPAIAKKTEEPKKPERPPLPDDVAKWKKKDYYRARKEGDPKLLQAVAYLGKKFVGSDPSARGLAELLKPLPPEKPAAAGNAPPAPTIAAGLGGHAGEPAKLVEAIVEALGRNGSATARDALEQILAGRLATDDDKTAVEATLKTLVAHSSDENDAILVRVIVSAESIRAADRAGPWPAKELQAKALELVKPAASFQLRTKLAEEIAARQAKFDPTDPTTEFLLASDPRNCGAQLVFYKLGDAPGDTKTAIEKQFLDYSSKAMAWGLGVSDAPQAGSSGPGGAGMVIRPAIAPPLGGPAKPAESEKVEKAEKPQANPAPEVANLLWSEKFLALLEPQLKPNVMERQPHLLLLAGTIPSDSTRAAIAKILRKRWSDGPKALQDAGLIDRVVVDPGMLIAIKTGPRRDSPSTTKPAPAAPARPGRTAKPSIAPPTGSKSPEATKKQQTEQDWMDASAKLVDAWRKRFSPATEKDKAKADADAAADVKPPEGFQFGSGAAVKYARRIVWPGDAPSGLDRDNLGPLEVYYFRAEETATVKRLVNFYARQAQLRTTETRMLDKSIWIDSLRTAVRKDRRRSLDVLITRTSGGTGEAYENNDEADFLVEVLIVEIAAPAKD